jgi:predicted small metal-binding protein
MQTTALREKMTSIRNGLSKVCLITRNLGEEPRQEALDAALSQRETVLFAEVEKNARELSATVPDWHVRAKNDAELRKLLAEMEELMHSIARMDETLAGTLQRRMSGIKAKLSSMYSSSRAACSYTAQSKL